MFRLINCEYQKQKRTFTKKAAFLAPVLTMVLCIFLGSGTYFQSGSYNWWYTMLLPGTLSIICVGVVQKDKKRLNYRGILCLATEPQKLWLGKIGGCVLQYAISCVIFFLGMTLGGLIFGGHLTPAQNGCACLILFVTFLWQIPFCMIIADKLGAFAAILINLGADILCAILAAKEAYWWIPSAIPARLMCPVIGVLPNGLSVPHNDPLLSTGVILPGVLITLALFIILSALTAILYRGLESK